MVRRILPPLKGEVRQGSTSFTSSFSDPPLRWVPTFPKLPVLKVFHDSTPSFGSDPVTSHRPSNLMTCKTVVGPLPNRPFCVLVTEVKCGEGTEERDRTLSRRLTVSPVVQDAHPRP